MLDYFTKVMLAAVALTACGPGRTTFARHPAGATAFDRAGSDPKAVAIADKVMAAAGGAERWNKIKQLRWTEVISNDGKVLFTFEEAWDRWDGRLYARMRKAGQRTDAVDTSHNPTHSTGSEAGDVVVMKKLYADGGNAYFDTGSGLRTLATEDVGRAVSTVREAWQFATVALCMPFLLEEPGTKLEYIGDAVDDPAKPPLDDIKVTLDPKDPNRTATYHVLVNRETNMIDRLDIVEAGQPDNKRTAYHLTKWIEVGGIKVATVDENVGAKGEVITFSDVTAGDPDESLYVPVVQ